MKIAPKKSPQALLLRAYNEVAEVTLFEKKDPLRVTQLRCSGLPYCINSRVQNHALQDHTPMDLGFAFYVTVGHAVHDVMQRYFPKAVEMIADFECVVCKTKFPFSSVYEHCDTYTKYNEVSLSYKGVHGHVDAIVKLDGAWYVVDFKTTSKAGIQAKGDKNPEGYERQLEAYCLLLDLQYGLKVEGGMLLYIARDDWRVAKPSKLYPYNKEVKTRVIEDLKLDLKKHKATMALDSVERYKRLLKYRCNDTYCKSCKQSDEVLIDTFKKHRARFPIPQFYERQHEAKD